MNRSRGAFVRLHLSLPRVLVSFSLLSMLQTGAALFVWEHLDEFVGVLWTHVSVWMWVFLRPIHDVVCKPRVHPQCRDRARVSTWYVCLSQIFPVNTFDVQGLHARI